MIGLFIDTMMWTGALIALVLLVRRPVVRWFGPEAAYALWAIPALRLLLPPITLPAWMAPQAPPSSDTVLMVDQMSGAATVPGIPVADPVPAPGFDLFTVLADVPLAETLTTIWLLGAVAFLIRRFAAYFSLRDALLAEGREVGRIRAALGPVRLVETPDTQAPLAFGVLDPVIAMPPGFMALPDRRARDLALAHELAHHRGFDLVINVLIQPLFALHWWNPLGRYGWLALRRDQEAACDARVVARASSEERAAYAALIASFAAARTGTSPDTALAAPMACPVLGETSILQRIRSLAVTPSSPRRRLMGRVMLGAAVLALPLTASISYAASDAVAAVPQPPAPPVPDLPPAPPSPPSSPDAPQPPVPPAPPEVSEAPTAITRIDPDDDRATRHVVIRNRAGRDAGEWTVSFSDRADHGRADKDMRAAQADLRRARAEVRAALRQGLAEAEGAAQAEILSALREGLAEADRALADMPRIVSAALSQAETARASTPRVIMMDKCRLDGDAPTQTITGVDGKQTIMICQPRVSFLARQGLEEARAEIARDKDMPEETRKRVLEQLDRQIARWSRSDG